jgi:hypothetical protein
MSEYTTVGPIQLKDEAAIRAAVEDVRNDTTATNFLVLGYEEGKSNAIQLVASGEGGLTDLKTHLAPDFLGYGYLRVISGDQESKRCRIKILYLRVFRPKFDFITYVGESAPLVKKGKIGTHIGTGLISMNL